MSGNWPVNPNLSVKGLTYRQWKVDYDPLCDECIARGRTHDLCRSITCLGPLKLCQYLLTNGVAKNGTETVFG